MAVEGTALTMTFNELATALGVSEHTVRRLYASKKLPLRVIELGRRRVVSRAQVAAFLAAPEDGKD